MSPRATRTRGAALLLTLLALSVAGAAAVAMLRAVTNATLETRARVQRLECERIVEGLTPGLLAWLGSPHEAEYPRLGPGLQVIGEWPLGGVVVEIAAIDLSGRLHIDRLDTFAADGLPGPLRMLEERDMKPPTRASQRSSVKPPPPPPLLEQIAARASERSGETIRAFPPRRGSAEGAETEPIIAAQWITAWGESALNARTAPVALLEAALRGRDPAAARALLDLRRADRPIPDSVIARVADPRGNDLSSSDRYVPITGASSAAGFLVTMRHLPHATPQTGADRDAGLRRWWIVAERDPRLPSGRWLVRESRRID